LVWHYTECDFKNKTAKYNIVNILLFACPDGRGHNLLIEKKLSKVDMANDISTELAKEFSSYECNNCTLDILCRKHTVLYSKGAIFAPIQK
jgi:hypothetical protein